MTMNTCESEAGRFWWRKNYKNNNSEQANKNNNFCKSAVHENFEKEEWKES